MATMVDIAIVGAGVVGLAIAREFALRNRSCRIVVLEQAARAGTGISSRSSEVIHAGLYYPPAYLKTTLCVRGRELLYDYCTKNSIPHRRIGKLVVAGDDEEHEHLHALAFRAQNNGIADLQWLDRKQLRTLEPAVEAKGAIFSPSTGIVDSTSLMQTLEREAISLGVTFAFHTTVTRITRKTKGFELHCDDANSSFVIAATQVINGAGLHATSLARRTEGFSPDYIPHMVLAKGDYFAYSGSSPFTHLVYPVPASGHVAHGLGIHATLDLHGGLRFGPDLDIVPDENYHVSEHKRGMFAAAIRHYFPALDAARLQPAYAGIRPRLATGSKKTADFCVQASTEHGVPGLVNLFGIESPGLTSALALAEHVVALELPRS